jgi:hypothetical protein
MEIRFGDHPSFHRAAAGMVGVSAILAVALHPVTPFAPVIGGIAGIAAGAALGYGKSVPRIALAAVAAVPVFALVPSAAAMIIPAIAMSLALSVGLRGSRAVLSSGLAAVVSLIAMWTALRFGHAAKLATWSPIARDGVAAAAMGMVAVLALLPRHLTISSDPVAAAVRGLPANLDGELADLCKRSVAIWTQTKEQLGDRDAGKALVRDGVLKALEVASKSATVKLTGASATELTARAADLDARIAAATDAEVKTQYESARAAVGDQLRYREQIVKGGERLVARMHNHVAALEKFQLAATGLEHARAASAGATAVKQLAELSQDVAASGEALAELELGAAATATAT